MNNAFNDPIQDIMIQYGLKEEIFFKQADEITLAGPFSNVKVLLTDKNQSKWVDTHIVGSTSLILLKDVGAPITVIRVMQENMETGEIGRMSFECEIPLNFKLDQPANVFTAISVLDNGQYFGFYFGSQLDSSVFHMKLHELKETLSADDLKKRAIQ